MPYEVIGKRLVPLILSRYVILEDGAHKGLLPFILEPCSDNDLELKGLLPEHFYKVTVIPEILKMFHVHETSIRLALLAHFHIYMYHFNSVQLNGIVLKELKLGMQDADDRIVRASMHALTCLVPLIGGPQVTGLVHSKVFADGIPKNIDLHLPKIDQVLSMPKKISKNILASPISPLSQLLTDDLVDEPNIKLQLLTPTVNSNEPSFMVNTVLNIKISININN